MDGRKVLTGTAGTIYWNGNPVLEVANFNAEVEIERSDVYVGMDKDTKANGYVGSFTFELDHVYSRAYELLQAIKERRDPRVLLSIAITDPDAVGGQIERVDIGNAWFTKFPLINFTKGEHVKQEFEGGFRAAADSEFSEWVG